MKLNFLGAAGTVTGSKYLLETAGRRVLIDCGLFQGLKELRLRNWNRLPIAPDQIDAVILTHAHLDHSGYLPLLIRNGFKGPVYCTAATKDLCSILLPDSASPGTRRRIRQPARLLEAQAGPPALYRGRGCRELEAVRSQGL